MQAFGFDFKIHSASEANEAYRDFCAANHPDCITHFFDDIERQLASSQARPCLLCRDKGIVCSESSLPSIDLLVAGSPCDPYSVIRQKRFSDGNAKRHRDYNATMSSVTAMLQKYGPKVAVLEQVLGFNMPFEAKGVDTPYTRPVVLRRSYLLRFVPGFSVFWLGKAWGPVVL